MDQAVILLDEYVKEDFFNRISFMIYRPIDLTLQSLQLHDWLVLIFVISTPFIEKIN